MLVKNLTKHDLSFMFTKKESTPEQPLFDVVNIVTGWTVEVSDDIWEEISKQTKSINTMRKESVEIEGVTMKDFNGKSYTPKQTRMFLDKTIEVNLVEHLISTHSIEVKTSEEAAKALPPRAVMESFLRRQGEKFTDKTTDVDLAAKVTAIKAELALLESL